MPSSRDGLSGVHSVVPCRDTCSCIGLPVPIFVRLRQPRCFVRRCISFPYASTLATMTLTISGTVLLRHPATKKGAPPLKYLLLPWRGTFAQRRALSNPILTEAVGGLVLQRCIFVALGLSASTPKPMSVGNPRRSRLILYILQRRQCTVRFSLSSFALTFVHRSHLTFTVAITPTFGNAPGCALVMT